MWIVFGRLLLGVTISSSLHSYVSMSSLQGFMPHTCTTLTGRRSVLCLCGPADSMTPIPPWRPRDSNLAFDEVYCLACIQ